MNAYRDAEDDLGAWHHDRCVSLSPGEPLPNVLMAIRDLDLPVGELGPPAPLTGDALKQLVSAAFGRLPPHAGGGKARRTSPSGGARHPTEGYIFCLDVRGLERGVWHVRGRKGDLVRIAELPPEDWLRENLSGLFLREPNPDALLVVTSVFQRNMFRYREPRTLRTIFMDAGHLLATVEMVAAAMGLRTSVHQALSDEQIERLLGLNGLAEGVVGGAALKGRS